MVELSGKSFEEIFVGMCPERIVEGKALEELKSFPQIVSGNNSAAIEKCTQLFNKITPSILVANSLEEAELAKLYCITYRDMTFSIGNAFCLAAKSFGIDSTKNQQIKLYHDFVAYPAELKNLNCGEVFTALTAAWLVKAWRMKCLRNLLRVTT